MEINLETFKKDLISLKLYIEFQNESYKISNRYFKSNEIKTFENLELSNIKRFNYNSHIISLYGVFERFIENISISFLNELSNNSVNYESLPIELKQNNILKNVEILSNLNLKKHKNLKAENLIKTLNDNLNNNVSFLNSEAFIQHKSNFRIRIIDDFFKNMGINSFSNIIRNYSPIRKNLEKNFSEISLKKSLVLFKVIDHLADIRNDIAHGAENVEILHYSILYEYIDFISDFGESINNFMNDELLKTIFKYKSNLIEPLRVFDNSILCFEVKNFDLNINDKIIIQRENKYPKNVIANIMQIQVDKKEVNSVLGSKPTKVGILLDCKIKNTNKFGVIK